MKFLETLKTKTFKHHNFTLVNCDTDSISFRKPNGEPFSTDEVAQLTREINSLMPDRIIWEPDGGLNNSGVYPKVIVVAAKNYLLDDGEKIKIKGSSLKATMKEPALKTFIREVLELLRTDQPDKVLDLYNQYAERIVNGIPSEGIEEFCFKKTITKSVLNPTRTNESRILDALNGVSVNEGDRVWLFFKTEKEYCLREQFDGTYCRKTLLSKLYKTLLIFKSVLDISNFPNYALKRNQALVGLTNSKERNYENSSSSAHVPS